MKKIDLNKLAREIVEKNQYLTIASNDSLGNPWVSPVAYVFDKDWNFYFVSLPDSKHSRNIESRKKVAVAIFDSRQKWGTGVGLQVEGEIKKIPFLEIPRLLKLYFSREYPYGQANMSDFVRGLRKMLQNKIYLLYRFTPKKVWMNDPREKTDVRVEVSLK